MLGGHHQHVVGVAIVQVEVAGPQPDPAEVLELGLVAQGVDNGPTALLTVRLQEELGPREGRAAEHAAVAVWDGGTGPTLQQQSGTKLENNMLPHNSRHDQR